MPRILGCADVTPMDQCGFAVQGETLEEVIEHLITHGKERHDYTEEDITPEMRSLVRSRVREVPARKPPAFTPVPRARPQLLYCADVHGGECIFAVQTDDINEILGHLRLHSGDRHLMKDEGMMLELLEMARERIRAMR